jgi:hypothetical protein
MDRIAAAELIRTTFQNSFDKGRYVTFVKNLLNSIDESKAFSYYGQYVPEKFRDFVKGYERVGTFTDPEGLKLDVLIVHLKSEATLARARTSQRNFIANYLKTRDAKDAGLIAFVSPNPEDWRFSFVKMDYKIVEKGGKFKAEEDFTPARRYSFLVGSHESSHTAQRQLLPILADDKHNPTLDLIENAFNIETVTKEFFEKYRDLFLHVKEALDKLAGADKALKKEFEEKGVNTADFAKKLLGQIVFLYFLQKKGWFGVARNAAWGSGRKDFLRQLFEGKLMKYKNFFDDVLEPLFYEALAVEREANYYSKFNCKIPFLNGGLFDPLNGYDWVHTDITLDNDLFSNTVKTKEGDIGTGILDIFDRYNFTVKEDEPLEKEVAVDPEMLGKVFENLLEVNDRKSKGTYYTPREIVHYMCQESLINYLATALDEKVSKDEIAIFIRMGDTVIEHESRIAKKGEETETYSYKLPENIRTYATLLDNALARIRVCDPAIGSGAFPVGMMNEIVRARQTLTTYLPSDGDRSSYDFKRHAIQESLYGVDIEPGAVEIAKLRLWLSLIVDEDDIGRIKPLPNLDYRIMQGNSLLEEFEGIRLFDEKLLESSVEDREKGLGNAKDKINVLQQEYFALHSGGKLTDVRKEEIQAEIKRHQNVQKQLQAKPKMSENVGMFDAPNRAGEVLNELKTLHRAFFEATQRRRKDEIKKQIESLEWELIEISLTEKKKGDLLAKLKRTRVRPFFLWRLHFADVFREKGGFDVVIANPPYKSAWSMTKEEPQLRSQLKKEFAQYPFLVGHWDLYIAFAARGHQILRENGSLSFIIPNPILKEKYAAEIRKYLLERMTIVSILSFNDINVFENVSRRTTVLAALKRVSTDNYSIKIFGHQNDSIAPLNEVRRQDWLSIPRYLFLIDSNAKEADIIAKIDQSSNKIGNYFYVNVGVTVSSIEKGLFTKKDIVGDEPRGNAKRFFEGRDVQRWKIRYRGLWLDYRVNELSGPRSTELFENQKIVVRRASDKNHFLAAALDTSQQYTDDRNVLIVPYASDENSSLRPKFKGYEFREKYIDLKYALAILSSKLTTFYFKKRFATESLQGATSDVYPGPVRSLPIKELSLEEQKPFIGIVDTILAITEDSDYLENSVQQAKVREHEKQIDQLVYELYALTADDIRVLEESIAE